MTNERITQTFFLQNPETVAKGLLGRYLVRATPEGDIYARMTEVAAWNKAEGNTSPKFTEQNLGGVSVSNRRGSYLIDITCGSGNDCVTIWGAEFELENDVYRARSPGKVSESLEVTDELDGTSVVQNGTLWIEGSPVSLDQVLQRNKKTPSNCRGFFYVPNF